jgi:hypothetical protein
MNSHQGKRKRRRAKLKLYGGCGAVRPHTKKGGRTGAIRHCPSKVVEKITLRPNPPYPER